MREDGACEGKGPLQSPDPLEEPKRQVGRGLIINVIMGGLSMLCLYLPEIREANPFLARLNGWILASGYLLRDS